MNKIILMGRLTRDPETMYSQGDSTMAIAKFTLAVDRRFKRQGEPDADFFNCTAFRKQAEFVQNYLKQGTKVVLSGRVQNDNYTNKDGVKVYSVQIIVEEIEFAESKAASSDGYDAPPVQSQNVNDGFVDIPQSLADELPFA